MNMTENPHPINDAVHVEGLSHQYPAPKRSRRDAGGPKPRTLALDGVSFDVRPGEIFGVLGPNGGGKSTLFRILSTQLKAWPGEPSGSGGGSESGGKTGGAAVCGHDVVADPGQVRRQLGVVFQSPSLDGKLTAVENLKHQGRLYGLSGSALAQQIEQWLTYFGLRDRQDEYVERFSGGMRRRLEVAKALLHGPRVLLMDEPATGLDPAARRDLWQKLTELRDRDGMTIVLTTHLMDEADRCDRLAIMNEGKLIAIDTPDRLKAKIGGDVITVEPETNGPGDADGEAQRLAAEITERFGPWPKDTAPTVIDGRIRFEKPDGARVVADVAAAFPKHIRGLSVGRPTIEDVFLHLTGTSLDN